MTHNPSLIGNWHALGWGLLGVFIKGGLWIGFAGALLGMGIGGKRYRPLEGFLLLLAMVGLLVLGTWLFNRPFDPAHRVLPRIYFSADWYWEPNAQLKPRPEVWGGLLLALLGLSGYLLAVRRDRMAGSMAAIGFLAGGVGFALGQSVQAAHAWSPHWFQWGLLARLEPHINWWNMMEITFGATFAALLACALWLHQRLGDDRLVDDCGADSPATPDVVTVSPVWEGCLLSVYAALIAAAEFSDVALLEPFLQTGFIMGLLPIVAILGGRYGAYFYALPIVALPIAGKTLRELAYRNAEIPLIPAWILLVALPLAAMVAAAWWFARRSQRGQSGTDYARGGLVLSTCLYWSLNFAFFRFAWPWQPWTARTPSGLIFTVCAITLILAAIRWDGYRLRSSTTAVSDSRLSSATVPGTPESATQRGSHGC